MSVTRPAGSRGFTLVELMIVTVLGSLVIMATLNILVSNQRTLTAAASKIRGQQTLRSGMGIIYGELREISPATGDLVDMGSDSIEVRAPRTFGLVCNVDLSGSDPRLTVQNVGDPFVQDDSIFVLAANLPATVADDVWKLAIVNSVVSAPSCNGTDPAQLLEIDGTPVGVPPDSISVGAPVRAFVHYIYGLFLVDGQVFLGREILGSGGTVSPSLVGPLRRVQGTPTFTYWDGFGTAAIVPSQVERIQIVLRTSSVMPGGVLQDSLVSDIHPRN